MYSSIISGRSEKSGNTMKNIFNLKKKKKNSIADLDYGIVYYFNLCYEVASEQAYSYKTSTGGSDIVGSGSE